MFCLCCMGHFDEGEVGDWLKRLARGNMVGWLVNSVGEDAKVDVIRNVIILKTEWMPMKVRDIRNVIILKTEWMPMKVRISKALEEIWSTKDEVATLVCVWVDVCFSRG